MKRAQLVRAVVNRTGLSEPDATAAVDVVLDELKKAPGGKAPSKKARPSSHSLPPNKQHEIAQDT